MRSRAFMQAWIRTGSPRAKAHAMGPPTPTGKHTRRTDHVQAGANSVAGLDRRISNPGVCAVCISRYRLFITIIPYRLAQMFLRCRAATTSFPSLARPDASATASTPSRSESLSFRRSICTSIEAVSSRRARCKYRQTSHRPKAPSLRANPSRLAAGGFIR